MSTKKKLVYSINTDGVENVLQTKDFSNNIEENNKIIADFLGWVQRKMPVYMKGRNMWMSHHKTRGFCSIVGEELFHESWDWLMPVIEKIESEDYTVNIFKEETEIRSDDYDSYPDEEGAYCSGEIGPKLIATYKAVVEFIKWRNEN